MQGEAGDQFYIVKEGEAVVYQSTPQGVKTVNRLFKADFFGERALLTQEPRYPSSLWTLWAHLACAQTWFWHLWYMLDVRQPPRWAWLGCWASECVV